jgi:DNA repair protein RecO (recombination protein O)
VTLLTETDGSVGARFRGGRKSTKRASGGIPPFHTLEVSLDDRGGDLMTLKETRIATVRSNLVGRLAAMEVAGAALRWARHLFPARQPEPAGWRTLIDLLDALDAPADACARPLPLQALAGLSMLAGVGYALELDRCVVCGKECPPRSAAYVDARRGGVVCRTCGGGTLLLDGRTRALASHAQRADGTMARVPSWLDDSRATKLSALVTDAMAAHANLDPPP